ncbi:MAG: CPBP family intramembrane metalloprotease [Clostridia bacterium]|nr:CPBP family intramembrane metalloprotease [Clostridia bacterium]
MRKILPPLILSVIIVVTLRVLSIFNFEYSQLVYSAISIVLLLGGGLILRLFAEKKTKTIRFFKLRFIKRKDLPIVFWMAVTVISGSFLLNILSLDMFSAIGLDVEGNMLAAYDMNNMWLSLLIVAVIPAIFEELFFRGATMSVLSKEKTAAAIFISAALFALVHGSMYLIFSSFFAGVVFGITVYLTDSIYASMLTHFINNIMAYILFTYSSMLSDAGFDDTIMFVTVLVFLVSVYATIAVTAKRYKKQLNEKKPIINEGEIIWEKRKEKRSSKKQ